MKSKSNHHNQIEVKKRKTILKLPDIRRKKKKKSYPKIKMSDKTDKNNVIKVGF